MQKQVLRALLQAEGAQEIAAMASALDLSKEALTSMLDEIELQGISLARTNDCVHLSPSRFYVPEIPGWRVLALRSVDSTNDCLKLLADSSDGPIALLADRQVRGKGTKGRSFYSPDENGLYLSVLLKRRLDSVLLVTPQAAVATACAIEEVSQKPTSIKWVNDILIQVKKVSGILAESVLQKEPAVVLGIGINLSPDPNLPAGLQETAGSVWDAREEVRREELIMALFSNIERFVREDDRSYHTIYLEKSALVGREIQVRVGEEWRDAIALDIDPDGRLVVHMDGRKQALLSEEVRLKRERS